MPSPDSRSRSPRRSKSPDHRRDRTPDRQRSRERRPRSRSAERSRRDARTDDRSRPDRDEAARRSTSPPKDAREKKPNYSKAFKWKSKGSGGDGRDDERSRDYRGRNDEYRPNRYGGRDDRDRRINNDRERDRDRDRDGDRRGPRDDRRDRGGRDSRDDRRGGDRYRNDDRRGGDRRQHRPDKSAKPPAKNPLAGAGVTFILVTVNDRLGTKATIPCLGSDTVGDFKKLVAAHIGRQPHEIMLKRQGERPFKDNITLEDYGVSNGVQLDLELDTGD